MSEAVPKVGCGAPKLQVSFNFKFYYKFRYSYVLTRVKKKIKRLVADRLDVQIE